MAYVMSFRHLVSASAGPAGGLHCLPKDGIPLVEDIFKRRARVSEGGMLWWGVPVALFFCMCLHICAGPGRRGVAAAAPRGLNGAWEDRRGSWGFNDGGGIILTGNIQK